MIKVTDLMVRDWVQCRTGWINEENGQIEYEAGTGFPVKIEFIYKATDGEGLLQYNDGENDGFEAAEYELFPIPLTPEILEKNGFGKERVIGYTRHYDKGTLVVYDAWNRRLKIIKERNIQYDSQAFGCEYVHHLQHALKLCGIDLQISL